jgi:hypothetical protein
VARLWLALAESEAELGLDISEKALDQMRAHLDTSTSRARPSSRSGCATT